MYKIGVFCMTGNVIMIGDYSDQENAQYLRKFMDVTFDFVEGVESIGFHLQAPNRNRCAHIYLYDRPASEVIETNNAGSKVEPMGGFVLKLSHDGSRDIWPLY
jgi:hypothetical protein